MRILIFGHARSGSSVLQGYLSAKFSLRNLQEPFTHNSDRELLIRLNEEDQFIAKITSGNFFFWNMSEIDLSIYDQVWVTERANKTDVLASVYISAHTGNYEKQEKQKFSLSNQFLLRWQKEMLYFYQFRQMIRSARPDAKHVTYNEVMDLVKPTDFYDPSLMDYSQDCENYANIKHQVDYIIGKLETEFGK